MVHQVNDKNVSPLTGPLPSPAAPARAQTLAAQATPAVRLDLSEASQAGKSAQAAPTAAAQPSSTSLVQEIRERVESGRFVIDYEQLGQALLRDVVARVTGRQS